MEITPTKSNQPLQQPTEPQASTGEELAQFLASSLESQTDLQVFRAVLVGYFKNRGIQLGEKDIAILVRGMENLISGVLASQITKSKSEFNVPVVNCSHIKPLPPTLGEINPKKKLSPESNTGPSEK